MTTIKLKNGSGAPTAGDLAQGEPALDLTNKRLYTEDSGGTVIEVGTNPTSVTTGAITGSGDMAINTDTLFVDVSANAVGIGTSSPSALLHLNSTSGAVLRLERQDGSVVTNDTLGKIEFYTNDVTNPGVAGFIESIAEQGSVYASLSFGTGLSGSATEHMRIDSGGYLIVPNGVTLGTAVGTYAAANTLDDYEEGTWTPALEASTTNPTPTAVTVNNATYTKVGRMVHIQAYITVNLTSIGSGGAQITGLPFTVGAGYAPVLFTHGNLILSSGGYFNNGSTKIIAIENNSTSFIGYAGTGTKALMISGTYEVA
jgi:hypothetical protein